MTFVCVSAIFEESSWSSTLFPGALFSIFDRFYNVVEFEILLLSLSLVVYLVTSLLIWIFMDSSVMVDSSIPWASASGSDFGGSSLSVDSSTYTVSLSVSPSEGFEFSESGFLAALISYVYSLSISGTSVDSSKNWFFELSSPICIICFYFLLCVCSSCSWSLSSFFSASNFSILFFIVRTWVSSMAILFIKRRVGFLTLDSAFLE